MTTLRWWRITFTRQGWTDASYEKAGADFDEAFDHAEREHCKGKRWSGGVEYVQIDEPSRTDLSITLDELAQRSNAVHDNLPF